MDSPAELVDPLPKPKVDPLLPTKRARDGSSLIACLEKRGELGEQQYSSLHSAQRGDFLAMLRLEELEGNGNGNHWVMHLHIYHFFLSCLTEL